MNKNNNYYTTTTARYREVESKIHLRVLRLNNNKLTTINEQWFRKIPNLETLTMNDNDSRRFGYLLFESYARKREKIHLNCSTFQILTIMMLCRSLAWIPQSSMLQSSQSHPCFSDSDWTNSSRFQFNWIVLGSQYARIGRISHQF